MNATNITNRVYHRLTGGRKVELEVDPKAIEDAIQEGFEKVRQWYFEPRLAQTISVVGTSQMGNSAYFLKTVLVRPARKIHKIYSTEPLAIYPGWSDAKIMGLERSLVDPSGYVHLAYYIEYAKSIDTLGLTEIDWIELADRYLISGYIAANRVTVSYYPQPQTIEDMTVQKAIDWLEEFVEAVIAKSVGRVRGKWRGGDLNIESDADSMITDANAALEKLDTELKNLDYHLA